MLFLEFPITYMYFTIIEKQNFSVTVAGLERTIKICELSNIFCIILPDESLIKDI